METIQYASVLPGTGKTHAACNLMLHHLKNKDGVLIYAAPTRELLKQVRAELITANPANTKYVYLVDSKSYSQVADTISALLDGTRDKAGWKLKQVEPGSIILCTQLAFALLPHTTENGIKNRANIKVIFDEARNCVLDSLTLNLPLAAAQFLVTNCITLYSESAPSSANQYVPFSVKPNSLEALARELAKNKVKRKLVDSLIDCLSTAQQSATRMYCAFNMRENSKKQPASFQIIQVPHRLFHGWRKVLLLSAFFETSQMYHFLRSYEALEQQDNESKKDFKLRYNSHVALYGESQLVNVTNKLVSKERRALIEKRFSQAYITYLSPEDTLSKVSFDTGVMVASNLGDFDVDAYMNKFKKLSLLDKINKEAGTELTLRRAVDLLLKKTNNMLDVDALTDLERKLLKHVSTFPGLLSDVTPLQWYTRVAVYLSKKWYKRLETKQKPLLVTCNVGDGRYLDSIEPYIQGGRAEELPFYSQGLNSYQKFHTVAFLAALNPKPQTRQFLKQALPNYDVDLDFTLNQCMQSVTRCSVRNTASNVAPLIIVPTKKLAEALVNLLDNRPTLIDPQEIGRFPFKSVTTLSGLSGGAIAQNTLKASTVLRGYYLRDYSRHYEEFNRLNVWVYRNKGKKERLKELKKKQADLIRSKAAWEKEKRELTTEFEKKLLADMISVPETQAGLKEWKQQHKKVGKKIWKFK